MPESLPRAHPPAPTQGGELERDIMHSTRTAPRRDEGIPGVPAPSGAGEETSYPIGGLAREAGVSTRTIRYYEEIGLLRTARRYAGGRRVFPSDALERLRFIGRLKRLGFSLGEIGELNDVFEMRQSTAAMLEALERRLETHLHTIDEQLAELSRLRDDLTVYRERIGGRIRRIEGE